MSCGVVRRRGSDLALLWLWRRLVVIAPIGPLAWEPPHAEGAALKRKKKKERPTTEGGSQSHGLEVKWLRAAPLIF